MTYHGTTCNGCGGHVTVWRPCTGCGGTGRA